MVWPTLKGGATASARSADSATSAKEQLRSVSRSAEGHAIVNEGAKAPRRPGHAVQRSRANVDFPEDYVPPPEFEIAAGPPPPYLRGPVVRLWILKQQLLSRVTTIIGVGNIQPESHASAGKHGKSTPVPVAPPPLLSGLISQYGFQGGDKGAARSAADALVSDLTGGAGAVWLSGPEEAVAELHERVFENFNRWARMTGATAVYSVLDDPDKDAILASHHAAYEARQSAMRERLRPQVPAPQPPPHPASAPGTAAVKGKKTPVAPSPQPQPQQQEQQPAHHTTSGSSSAAHSQAASSPQADAAAATPGKRSPPGKPGAGTGEAGDSAAASTEGHGGSGEGGTDDGAHHAGLGMTFHLPGLFHHHSPDHETIAADASAPANGEQQRAGAGDDFVEDKVRGYTDAAAARAVQLGARPPVEVELRGSTQPGSDVLTRITDLCLWYCIRAEAANLRFMPELLCWAFHQMRRGYQPPPPEEVAKALRGNDPETSFFMRTTVLPLYTLLKRSAKKEADNTSEGLALAVVCCRKLGRRRFLANSRRPNYDDLNEMFWRKECLELTYHSCDPQRGVQTISVVPKTFREKASWLAVAITFWRWAGFVAFAFHALSIVGADIVAAGGVNITGITRLDPLNTLMNAAGAFQTVGVMQFILALLAGAHALPFGSDRFWSEAAGTVTAWGVLRGAYATAWMGGLLVMGNSKALLGADLQAIFLVLCAAKAGCMLMSEGACTPGCGARNPVRRVFQQLEGVYYVAPAGGRSQVMGGADMAQPLSRKAQYVPFWVLVLAIKLVFDLQVLTQQQRLVATLQAAKSLNYLSPWADMTVAGYRHPIAVFGSWAVTFVLVILDSYIAFTLAAPLLGYFVLAKDGVGSIRRRTEVKSAFTRGVGWFNRTPMAAQFVKMCMPLAAARGAGDNTVFRRAWDAFVMSLRECDLVSNEEQCKLLYSDAILGVEPALPLFMYAGRVKGVIQRVHKVVHAADSASTDAEFLSKAVPDPVTAEALAEVLAAVPWILTLICKSHSAIGYADPHVGEAIRELFRPAHGQSLRDCVATLLEAEGNPRGTLRRLAGSVATLMIEFEKSSASTRLRGSPLLAATCKVLRHLHRLWTPPSEGDDGGHAQAENSRRGGCGGGGEGSSAPGHRAVDPSFPGVTLETIAAIASRDEPDGDNENGDAVVSVGATPLVDAHPHYNEDPLDSRSVPGILRLLQLPNELSGRLDGDGDAELSELYESLRDGARRVFYLLTMVDEDGTLKVAEAERRVTHYLNTLYMHSLPAVHSVLDMPSFSAVTPQYSEAVIYDKREFLTSVNKHGVSPMVYLKALHSTEWAHCCERLGVRNETEAWGATRDAQGTAISGEVEVRLWASQRGQTLYRTVHGVMEYARAIRLLATLQLELEYSLLEDAKPPGVPRLPQAELERDAALAGQWFTAERFQYVCACQRYAEHGEDDVRRRSDIDFLLMMHPLLSVAYFENSVSPFTGKRRLLSVCKGGRGVRYRLPCPGNPIADGIGEGKPENQNNAAPYVTGRTLQALDMNQEAYFEEALKLPNALTLLNARPRSGRPVVVLGLREHIYTFSLSAPAWFMSQQEYLFGVMYQRLMSSPLFVRMHYGHPDLFDKVWMATRGGTAKASSVINVSEDIFAGYTAALRGGESRHAEFLQCGKGRDVGVLQILVFEGKISAGTAISMTTRDNFRVSEGMDFARLASYYHTAGGFFISNALTVCSFLVSLYYMASMALTQMDRAILGSKTIYLLGEVSFLQWWMQLGLTSILPLASLYALEHGVLTAVWRTLHMMAKLGPMHFMHGIATKAYYFDHALAFGRCGYAATGRDFVLRHSSFHENYSATALSHIYLGWEALALLAVATIFGTFRSVTDYAFFLVAGWLFALSLLSSPWIFNPYQMELRFIKSDFTEWRAWLTRKDGGPDVSWRAWYERDIGSQYSQANVGTRVWRLVRVSRLLLFTALLVTRMSGARQQFALLWATYPALGVVAAVLLQAAQGAQVAVNHLREDGGAAVRATASPVPDSIVQRRGHCAFCTGLLTYRFLLVGIIIGVIVAGAAIVPSLFGTGAALDFVLGFLSTALCLRWASCAVHILSAWPLADGARGLQLATDASIGFVMLCAQFGTALCMPLGSVIHTHLLFSPSYADTVEVVTGTSRMLSRQGAGDGAKFLQLAHLGEMEFKRNARPAGKDGKEGGKSRSGKGGGEGKEPEGPENRIGIRRLRLRAVHELGGGGADGGMTPGPLPAGILSNRATWLQQFRSSEEPGGHGGSQGLLGRSASASPTASGGKRAESDAAADPGKLRIRVAHLGGHKDAKDRDHLTPAPSLHGIAMAGHDAAGGPPRVRKTLHEILAEHQKPGASSSAAAAAAEGGGPGSGHERAGRGRSPGIPRGPPRGGAGLKGSPAATDGGSGGVKPNFVIAKRGGADAAKAHPGPPRANTAGGKRVSIREDANSTHPPVADAIAALRNRLEHK